MAKLEMSEDEAAPFITRNGKKTGKDQKPYSAKPASRSYLHRKWIFLTFSSLVVSTCLNVYCTIISLPNLSASDDPRGNFGATEKITSQSSVITDIAGSFSVPSVSVKESGKEAATEPANSNPKTLDDSSNGASANGNCAINLYGLPRSFKSLVLPSFVENVVKPNLIHQCDYFVHYYNLTKEKAGRSGLGGTIDPSEILHLEQALELVAKDTGRPKPTLVFVNDTEANFWKKYTNLTDQITTAKGPDGRMLYFPHYTKNTVVNVIKMFHSQNAVWKSMEDYAYNNQHQYDRVGMFRSDVVYMTPLDIYRMANQTVDRSNKVAVIPSFAKYPVNDRLIYGPYQAVKIWAAERFERMDHHFRVEVPRRAPGLGLSSETFLALTIFPAILANGFTIQEDERICFLRCRADGSIWVNDCSEPERNKQRIEVILGRSCSEIVKLETIKQGWPAGVELPKANVRQITCF